MNITLSPLPDEIFLEASTQHPQCADSPMCGYEKGEPSITKGGIILVTTCRKIKSMGHAWVRIKFF
jgi:hypothetical protein